jgi:hypothetical protein
MADYYSLLSRAIAALPQSTPQARQAVYERARKALFNQLRAIQPAVAEGDIATEGRALDEAITRVELEVVATEAEKRTAEQPPAPAAPVIPPPGKLPAGKPAAGKASLGKAPLGKAPLGKPETAAKAGAEPAAKAPSEKPAAAPPVAPAPKPSFEDQLDSVAAEGADAPDDAPVEAASIIRQRPAAPTSATGEDPRASQRRILGIVAILIVLVSAIALTAWHFREQPEDLAKLKPQDSQSEPEASGKFGGRVGGEADADVATPPPRIEGEPTPARGPAVPVAQKAELWVASLQEPNKVDKIYAGTVVWRLDNVGGGAGEPVSAGIRGDVDVPDVKLKLTLIIRKNLDATLSASHTINVSFAPSASSDVKGVRAIGPIQMRRADAQSGEKVVGIPVPITENNFLIGLMRGASEARNVALLRSPAVVDLPMQLSDGRGATINLEKGPAGERVFSDAIDSWSR